MERILHDLTKELILLIQHNMPLNKAFDILESNIKDPKQLLLVNCMREISLENDNAQIIVMPDNKNSKDIEKEVSA